MSNRPGTCHACGGRTGFVPMSYRQRRLACLSCATPVTWEDRIHCESSMLSDPPRPVARRPSFLRLMLGDVLPLLGNLRTDYRSPEGTDGFFDGLDGSGD